MFGIISATNTSEKNQFRFYFIFCIALFLTQCGTATKQTKQETTEIDSLQSEITCPKCGKKEMLKMPTDQCQIKFTCNNCKTDLYPKEGDCCVFCTYGNHKCPSKQ